MIRRLLQGDEDLLREAYRWSRDAPTWFQDADKVFNRGTEDNFVSQLADLRRWFVGIFNPSLEAIIVVEWKGNGQFEGHLLAHRRAVTEMIGAAISQLLFDLLDCGMQEAFVWVAARNKPIQKLCANIGFLPDGIVMWKGSYRGRVIRWLRHSVQRDQLLMENAA